NVKVSIINIGIGISLTVTCSIFLEKRKITGNIPIKNGWIIKGVFMVFFCSLLINIIIHFIYILYYNTR
ncbi:MAG TPA: hypothetical protein PL110_17495, partial [Candidatus Eremiobacteraeota bacterium]|nr:hypothetical protein [Candidatus Eremiobacteraeota bacterium]